MKGFDPEFADLPDYIVKITERIWEGRGIGLIRRWYAEDCVVHTSMGPQVGVPATIAGTLDTLAAFPDRRLLPEDIIWSGDDEAGYLSSHRVSAPATHLGDGPLGPATGRAIHFRAVADCLCRDNQVVEEWLARDNLGILRQLGIDAREHAARLAAAEARTGREPWHLAPAARLRAGESLMPPVLHDHAAARLHRDTLMAIWTAKDLDRIADVYHPGCVIHLPGADVAHGHERLWRWLFARLAALPDAHLHIEHSIANDEPGRPARAATRFWLTGRHGGHGAFGPASGADILLLGMSHAEIDGGRIRNEWIVWDEVAVLKQVAATRG